MRYEPRARQSPNTNFRRNGRATSQKVSNYPQNLHARPRSTNIEPSTNVFINYIPAEYTEADLRRLCSEYGEIMTSKIMINLETGQSKCFGFVRFKTLQQAQAAIQGLNGRPVGNKILLAKYAEMYGLGEKSGLEIDEAAPHISDEYSIQSAIGQGNNNFTVSQLNRYVTAVANRGTVYDLTLIDKVTDSSGSLLRDNEAEVVRTMDDISSSTWDQLHQGMELMVSSHATFSGLDFSMAGKTGTAQQNELHADHALFVGYAPADSPEISVAVRIVNGYNSGYASEIGRDVSQIYFNPDLKDKLITGEAANLGSEMAGD